MTDPARPPDIIIGFLDPSGRGKGNWTVKETAEVAHECPLCMKAILDEEWQEHVAWHAKGELA